MKILIVTQSKDILGGANRSLLDVIYGLKNYYSHDLLVITPGEGEFTENLKKIEIEYFCADYNQVSFVQMGDIKDPARFIRSVVRDRENVKAAKKIAKQLQSMKLDVIYINDTTNTVGYYLSKILKIPFVWHFRGYHHTIRKYILRDRKFCKDTNGMNIAISNVMKEYMIQTRRMNPDRIRVIYNGVANADIQIFQPWEDSINEQFHCVHCGHLSEAKGQRESILAIAELKKRGYTNIILHLAGTPLIIHGKSYKDYLQELICRHALEDQVIFEGEVKNMGELRKRMQVELMCSLAEPFGRVTVEGMQAGLVVIGCDTGATPEIITDGVDGLIYHQGDEKDLADKIENVYLNHKLGNRLSSGAITTTTRKFTMKENVSQINEVLNMMGNKLV